MFKEMIHRLEGVSIELPERQILARLGYDWKRNELNGEMRRKLKVSMSEDFALCRPYGVWGVFAIESARKGEVVLAGGGTFFGREFVVRCGDGVGLWLGAVTLGDEIVRRVMLCRSTRQLEEAAMAEAVAIEAAVRVREVLLKSAKAALKKEPYTLNERLFFTGRWDLEIDSQRAFFERLPLAELRMKMGDNCKLEPMYSETVVACLDPLPAPTPKIKNKK